MNNTNSHTGSNRWKKWIWAAMILLMLMVLARLSLKSDRILKYTKNRIETAANERLNARLAIGEIRGDLWNQVRLYAVTLAREDTLARVDSILVKYNIWSLLSPVFEISVLRVSGPELDLGWNKDGKSNLAGLVDETDKGTDEPGGFPFQIDSLDVKNGGIRASIAGMAADSIYLLSNINAASRLTLLGDTFEFDLRELSFDILKTRLNAPISVTTSATGTNRQWTLESLVMATGSSILRSSGLLNTADSTARLDLTTEPLSWQDLNRYVDRYPENSDLRIGLGIRGTLSRMELTLQAEANGLRGLQVTSRVRVDSALQMNSLRVEAETIDLQSFLNTKEEFLLQRPEFSGEGQLDFSDVSQAVFKGTFSTGEVRYGRYQLDRLESKYRLNSGKLTAELNGSRGRQRITTSFNLNDLWSGRPAISLTAAGNRMNPGYWIDDPAYTGSVNFRGDLSGEGLPGDQFDWEYRLNLSESEIGGQPVASAQVKGRISPDRLTARAILQIVESRISLDAQISDYTADPSYKYELQSGNLNLAEFKGAGDLETRINGRLKGEGKYTGLEKLQLVSSIRIDSSMVNNETIRRISTELQISDTVATLADGQLESSFAEGNFSARIHLLRMYDRGNRLNVDLNIKEIDPLAPLLDLQQAQATGRITGELYPIFKNNLEFKGNVSLENVIFNGLFTADQIEGEVEALVIEHPEYVVNINLTNPTFQQVALQDLTLMSRGKIYPDSVKGNYQFSFSSPGGSRIEQFGLYSALVDSLNIHTELLQVISDEGNLNLVKPFDATYARSVFRMDTLRLASENNTSFELAIPYADSVVQRGYLSSRNLDIEVLQNTLLNQTYLKGHLSGNAMVNRRDTMLSASANMTVSQIAYRETRFDSLNLNLAIEGERLDGALELRNNGSSLLRGTLNLPFKMGDPNQFGPDFYNEPVSGTLTVQSLNINQFKGLFEESGLAGTEGVLFIDGALSGDAGNPGMRADMRVEKPVLSGVPLDSLTARLDYNHERSRVDLNASVTSLKQRAAEINARVPFYLDLKGFRIVEPRQDDEISIDIESNDFNLAALNDFVNRAEIRDIRGRLNGSLAIGGMIGDLSARGGMSLAGGAIRVVKAGVNFDNIEAAIQFREDIVQLERFRANSGKGIFNSRGTIALDNLKPGKLNFSMNAKNFRIANTRDYSATVNMEGKVDGTVTQPNVSGSIEFTSGYVYLRNFGEKSIETIRLEDSESSDYSLALYDSLSLSVGVTFDRRFFIRNRRFLDMELELAGNLDLVKNPSESIQMFGTMNTVGGYARPLGKRFDLEQGRLTFIGDPTNPSLNIRTLYLPPQPDVEIRIWYIIEGNVENPKFKYESDPPMELENIISYTLFGQPFYAMDSWKQVVAGSGKGTTAADVAMDVILDKVESLATRKLGIDVVQIDNTRIGGDSGTVIKTGWYINPKVFFAIQNEIAGSTADTGFILEYKLSDRWKLIINQGNDNREGIDLQWKKDY